MDLQSIFESPFVTENNFIRLAGNSSAVNQQQTNEVFSDKWEKVEKEDNVEELEKFQKSWYLKLYGFTIENDLKSFLEDKEYIIDAGCGLGYKAAWFAELSPTSTVIGIDFSEAANIAAKKYAHLKNLYFIQGDIANTGLKEKSIDYVSCDQVIMHTENPEATFAHLSSLLKNGGQFACYVYTKKALPRELLDDYFRKATHNISSEDLWKMSRELTQLGKTLSELKTTFTAPDIPLLGIKGGKYDIQRFLYWNFLKCFWKEDWGIALCDSTNYDWYSPSNAKRYSREEFDKMGEDNGLTTIYKHSEEACHTARFKK
jgi:ubiquinone/menaquinone biosynthesis C-methylase UbiE